VPRQDPLAARPAGYPWPEQMARKMLRFVEKRRVHAARNGSSANRKYWQRFELGIHGVKSWGRNWNRQVRETRSSSSPKRFEPAAHPCRGPVTKPEITRSGRVHQLSGARETWLAPNDLRAPVLPPHASRPTPHVTSLAAGRKLGSFFLLDFAIIRSKSQYAND